MRAIRTAAVAGGLLLSATGCDYTGDWLFPGKVEGVPGVDHLGELVPAKVESPSDVQDAVIYGDIGPTGTAAKGGVTFTFRGTGENVCIFVDPELVFWNQSVNERRSIPKWSYPDNVHDDGDIDLFAGLGTYYNGTAAHEDDGGEIGDFRVRYQDSLGQPVEISLNECRISSRLTDSGGHSGRGTPEYCTIQNTQPGVSYMVLMETWSTPLDDNVMSYGLLVTEGSCTGAEGLIRSSGAADDECVITGEARDHETGEVIPGSVAFEETYCDSEANMSDFCEAEAADKDCRFEPCFCGDPADTPSGGAR